MTFTAPQLKLIQEADRELRAAQRSGNSQKHFILMVRTGHPERVAALAEMGVPGALEVAKVYELESINKFPIGTGLKYVDKDGPYLTIRRALQQLEKHNPSDFYRFGSMVINWLLEDYAGKVDDPKVAEFFREIISYDKDPSYYEEKGKQVGRSASGALAFKGKRVVNVWNINDVIDMGHFLGVGTGGGRAAFKQVENKLIAALMS